MRKLQSIKLKLTLVSLLLLLTACSVQPNKLPSEQVKPAQIPPLPANARQPARESWCLPTCLEAVAKDLDKWQKKLTEAIPLE